MSERADYPAPIGLASLNELEETSRLATVGWRMRTSPFVPHEPVTRIWRDGVLSSKQLDAQGGVHLALVDVGINPDLRAGPVIDATGDLVGFVITDGDPTNLTRVAPGEAVRRLLAAR